MTVSKSLRPVAVEQPQDPDALNRLMQNLVRVPGALSRVTERVPMSVQVGLGGPNTLYLGASQNISDGGLFVCTTTPRPVGEHFAVEFALPGDDKLVRCMVEVAWVRADGPNLPGGEMAGMGLKFLAVDSEDQTRVATFVAHRRNDPLLVP